MFREVIFTLIYTLFNCLYYFIILFFSFGYFALNKLGAFNIVYFELGSIKVKFVFILITVVALILPILVFKVGKKFRLFILVIFLAFYCFIPGIVSGIVYDKYSDFSYEEWTEYPVVRQTMYSDLLGEDGIVGKSSNEVTKKLGEPDYKTDYGENKFMYAYRTSPGTVRVYINNDKVTDIEYTPSW